MMSSRGRGPRGMRPGGMARGMRPTRPMRGASVAAAAPRRGLPPRGALAARGGMRGARPPMRGRGGVARGKPVPALVDYGHGLGAAEIDSNTSSDDPNSISSRVFVGNLDTMRIAKEDVTQIFARYGQIGAISMHKGYAFVQYTNEVDARSAVNGEDQRVYADQVIDVNIANEPKSNRPRKRRPQNQESEGADVVRSPPGKKPRTLMAPVRPVPVPGSLAASVSDILICGNCKNTFSTIELLGQHKLKRCMLRKACIAGESTEPEVIVCGQCGTQYSDAWSLLQHCQVDHCLHLYVDHQAKQEDASLMQE